ncbi:MULTISPECIES: hypothetical protein [Nocardiopsis]|uniref:hypothetical protein n=1 Tax=Nocardiopsis TaxID=2013 RepID=UPI0026CB67BA|nr:hypothetical protein [Nocardiopsis sp. BMP B8015]
MAALRSRHECPVVLLTVCPGQAVADWYAEPIRLGHPGFVLRPLVVGPSGIPAVTAPEEVGRRPSLAVLSAAAHGGQDMDVLKALHTGLDAIDRERATKYIGFTLNLLAKTVGQAALEELMMTDTYEYSSAWTESLKAEGEARAVLRVLSKRGIDVPEKARRRISGCRDHDQLDAWLDRSVTITHIDQLFDE